MSNKILPLIAACLLIALGCATPSGKIGKPIPVLKQYQFAALDNLMTKEQRPIAVFLHAEWCKYCKNMEQTTLQSEKVVQLLNKQYYFISFDGEQKEKVIFRDHPFHFQPTGRNTGTHELATALGTMGGELTYPVFVILNPEYEIVFQHNAFLEAQGLLTVLGKGIN